MTVHSALRHRAILPALLCAALAGSPARAADDAAPAPSDDGLVEVEIKNVDHVHRRPGVDWKAYTKVLIAPVEVASSKSWDPRDYGAMGLSAADVDRMRRELAALTAETFAEVLAAGGYTVVQAPGEGVLEVQSNIVNLYINAPDTLEAGRSRIYFLNTGQMTLSLALRDSVTGTLLAEARDRKRGTEYPWLTIANSVVNRAEAERALKGWAKQLRGNLDAARQTP
jgi:Protein of unknown function (DUF3313)